MYSLTICFGPTGTLWAFLFKNKESAEVAHTSVSNAMRDEVHCFIEDEYGQKSAFGHGQINGIVLEDLDLTDEAKILRSLANARNEVKARQRAATDPVIRTAAQQGGPSVLTPFRQN